MSFLDSLVGVWLVLGSRLGAFLVMMLAGLVLVMAAMFSGGQVGLLKIACTALVLMSINRLRRK